MKRKAIRVGIVVVVLAVLAGVFWYNVYYRGNLPIGLHTVQAEDLVDTLTQKYTAVDKAKVEYRLTGCIVVSCYGEDLKQEQLPDLLDTIQEGVQTEEFQTTFSQTYDRRYGTQGAALEYVEVQVYRNNTLAPDFRFSSTAPFQKWENMG